MSNIYKLSILAAFLLPMTGCITSATLISQDKQRYVINVDQVARKLTATIDGVEYTGTAVSNQSVGTGFAQSFGTQPSFATSTVAMQGSQGQAMLVSQSGSYIKCLFNKNGLRLIGECQSDTGRTFILITE